MPTEIERCYEEQGYRLPAGLTWEAVTQSRARWNVRAILVPVAVGDGCIGWAVPHIDGKPLKHP